MFPIEVRPNFCFSIPGPSYRFVLSDSGRVFSLIRLSSRPDEAPKPRGALLLLLLLRIEPREGATDGAVDARDALEEREVRVALEHELAPASLSASEGRGGSECWCAAKRAAVGACTGIWFVLCSA